MINKISLVLLLLLPICTYSQKDSNTSQKDSTNYRNPYISVSGGLGIPINNFHTDAPVDFGSNIGLASDGYSLNILGEFPIAHNHWGIIGVINYNAEPFNVNQRFLDLCVENTDDLISSSYSDYKEMFFMAGISFSMGKKSTFDFKLLAGDNICRLAGYSLNGTSSIIYGSGYAGGVLISTYTEDITSSLQAANSFATMAYDFGIDWRFIQKKHIMGLLSCDFLYSQAYFNTTYNNTEQAVFHVNYYLLNLTGGIGYRF